MSRPQKRKAQQDTSPKKRVAPSQPSDQLNYQRPTQEQVDEEEFTTFEKLHLNERLIAQVKDGLKIEKPSPVQSAAISKLITTDHDVFIKAQTGSGKTLAYLLPVIHSILEHRVERTGGTLAIFIAPTRELVLQIAEVLETLVRPFPWLVSGILLGGEKKKSEKARIRKGVPLLVCTPGRLLDHLLTTQCFKTSSLKFLVLDEADRLLDMGFEKPVKQIVNMLVERHDTNTTKHHRTILTSATLTDRLKRLAAVSLQDTEPLFVDVKKRLDGHIGDEDEDEKSYETPKSLIQSYTLVPTKYRLVTLACLLGSTLSASDQCKVIVFLSSVDAVEFHTDLFGRFEPTSRKNDDSEPAEDGKDDTFIGLPRSCIFKLHGNMAQPDRKRTFVQFKKASRGVMFCTDVAARGLDLPSVNWIVQYDPPGQMKEYIHRVGRTARMGHAGKAILFLMPSEVEYIEMLKKRKVNVGEVNFLSIVQKFCPKSHRDKGEDEDGHALPYSALRAQTRAEALVGADKEGLGYLAKRAFGSYVRAYATHSTSTKHIFHIKKLHLGHIAKSFALRQPPNEALKNLPKGGAAMVKEEKAKKEKDGGKDLDVVKKKKRNNFSSKDEFSSGF